MVRKRAAPVCSKRKMHILRWNIFIAKCKGPFAGMLCNKTEITFYVINTEIYRGKSLHFSLHNTQFPIHLSQECQLYHPMLQSFPLLGKSESFTDSTQAPHTPKRSLWLHFLPIQINEFMKWNLSDFHFTDLYQP